MSFGSVTYSVYTIGLPLMLLFGALVAVGVFPAEDLAAAQAEHIALAELLEASEA